MANNRGAQETEVDAERLKYRCTILTGCMELEVVAIDFTISFFGCRCSKLVGHQEKQLIV